MSHLAGSVCLKLSCFLDVSIFLNQLEVTLHFLANLGSESILLTSCSLVPFTWNISFYLHAEAVSIFDDEVHSWEITNRYVLFFKPFNQSCLIFLTEILVNFYLKLHQMWNVYLYKKYGLESEDLGLNRKCLPGVTKADKAPVSHHG